MSSTLPTSVRALLGLAALAVEEVRKLPETLPQAVTTVPVEMVSVAMQASMKFHQQLATLAVKGDELISQLRGVPDEPPTWATFDDDAPADGSGEGAAAPGGAGSEADLIGETGYNDEPTAAAAARTSRWDAVGAEEFLDAVELDLLDPADTPIGVPTEGSLEVPGKKTPAKKTPGVKTPAKKATAGQSTAEKMAAVEAAALGAAGGAAGRLAPAKKGPAKKAPAKKAAKLAPTVFPPVSDPSDPGPTGPVLGE